MRCTFQDNRVGDSAHLPGHFSDQPVRTGPHAQLLPAEYAHVDTEVQAAVQPFLVQGGNYFL
jgi:hypothetical protein